MTTTEAVVYVQPRAQAMSWDEVLEHARIGMRAWLIEHYGDTLQTAGGVLRDTVTTRHFEYKDPGHPAYIRDEQRVEAVFANEDAAVQFRKTIAQDPYISAQVNKPPKYTEAVWG